MTNSDLKLTKKESTGSTEMKEAIMMAGSKKEITKKILESLDRRSKIANEINTRIEKTRTLLRHLHAMNDERGHAIANNNDKWLLESYEKSIKETSDHIKNEEMIIGKLVIEARIIEEAQEILTRNKRS